MCSLLLPCNLVCSISTSIMGSKQSKPQHNQRGTGEGRHLLRGTMSSNAERAAPKRKQPLGERSMRSSQRPSGKMPNGRPTRQDPVSRTVGNSATARAAGAAALARAESRQQHPRTYSTSASEDYSEASYSGPGDAEHRQSPRQERNDSRLGRGVRTITVEVSEDEWWEFLAFRRSKRSSS